MSVYKGLDSVGYSDVPCVLRWVETTFDWLCLFLDSGKVLNFVCLEVLQYSKGLFPKHQGPETLEELATQM